MRIRYLLAFVIFMFSLSASKAQIDGDNIFATDQIINIELTFNQTNYWDSLTNNYEISEYMEADLVLTDITGTYSFPKVGVRLKGNSSYSHPGNKKSFKIDFNEYTSGQNYDGLKKLNFSNGFKDPTLMREKIFFDVCRAANVPAPRASYANVYFNGVHWGFYTVIEQIDDQFLDWRILDDDGNLFKAGDNFGGGGPGGGGDDNAADLVYYGTDQTAYESRYELKTNEEINDWSDLIALTDFINNSSAADFESQLSNHIELQEYLRSAALDNLFSNLDSYTGSARNYYVYHNLTTGKWEWIKWDGNESFGSYGGGGPGGGLDMTNLPLDYHDASRPLLENIFDSPNLYAQYQEEMCFLIEYLFNPDYLHPRMDEIKSMIQNSVYADNNKMYSNAEFDANVENNISSGGGPQGGTVYGLKSFVTEKHAYAENALNCVATSNDNILEAEAYVVVSPNPFRESFSLNMEGAEFHSLVMYDNTGKEIYQAQIQGRNTFDIQIPNLPNGMYFVRLMSEEGKEIKNIKVIKI